MNNEKTTTMTDNKNHPLTKLAGMDTVTFKVSKAGWCEEVELCNIPANTLAELLRYGAQRWWNDKTAGMDAEEAKQKINELWGVAIESPDGWQGRAPSQGRVVDPLAKEVQNLARDAIKKALSAKGITIKAIGKEKYAELVEAYTAKNKQALETQAQKILDARNGAEDMLGDLGLDLDL